MSELNLENEAESFKHHLESILKDIQDPAGISMVYNQVIPAFFDTTKLSQWLITDLSPATTMTLRNLGYATFYQSLSNYTVLHFNTLNTAFLEKIILQAVSLLPLVKMAQYLRLDDPLYNTEYHISDRMSVLVGALVTQFGLQEVDSFLYPLFTQHIFNGKHFTQSNSPTRVYNFGTMVKSRGGTFDVNYQQLQNNTEQTLHKWECTVIYQLNLNSPYILHRRTGQNKKQAKTRTLHDIDIYYTQNGHDLVRHCSPLSKLTHDQQPPVEPLSIPIDQLYQYDDDIQHPIPTTQLAAKRSHEIAMENHASTACGEDNNKHVSLLTHALLYDFSKLSCNEPSLSTITIPSPGLQDLPMMNGFNALTPAPSPSSTTTIKIESTNDEIMEGGDEDENHTKKQRTCQIDPYQLPQNECEHNMTPSTTDAYLIPITPQPNDTDLPTIALHLVSRLSVKDRLRFKKNSTHLNIHHNDAKGCLKTLAAKLGGHYLSVVGQCTPKKSLGYFTVTVRFGISGLELALARNNVKKSEAEGMAAHAIFALLDAAITTDGDTLQTLATDMVD